MKKRLFLLLSLSVAFVILAHAADQFTVTNIKGKITFLTSKGQRLPLEVKDIVDKSTVFLFPFHATLELVDQATNKKYTIKAPGRAPVSVLLKDSRNSVENLTRQYVKNMLANMTGSGVKGQIVTEPAATHAVGLAHPDFHRLYLGESRRVAVLGLCGVIDTGQREQAVRQAAHFAEVVLHADVYLLPVYGGAFVAALTRTAVVAGVGEVAVAFHRDADGVAR